jgi:hypothetical protein
MSCDSLFIKVTEYGLNGHTDVPDRDTGNIPPEYHIQNSYGTHLAASQKGTTNHVGSSSNPSDLYFEDTLFESWAGHWLP